ncbi:MAG: hypothetical protein VCA38_08425 [Roseibacillus sp.]|jgi:hypothetical protein
MKFKGWLMKTVVPMLLVSLGIQILSCGTIMYPERRGQSAGKIDPGVAVLDGLGLLLFLIPGVIAFAVDFNNGTIYLPGGSASLDDELGEQQLVAISIGTDGLTEESIELALREQLGSEVDISAPEVRVIRLDILDSAETTVPLK